jgi:membrane associated rhomboid family serine protease
MVMPLWDDNPFKRAVPPYVTWGLIAINLIVFLVESGMSDLGFKAMVATYGTTPAAVVRDSGYSPAVPAYLTLVSSLFLHSDILHFLGNMIFLFVFGDDIEDAMGPFRFVGFYLLCGIAAALAFVGSAPHSPVPLIGASGAIAGVLAAYLMLRPCAKITTLLFRFIVQLNAYWVISMWALWQVWQLWSQPKDDVAYMAHVGGFIAGAALFPLMRRSGVRLFQCIPAEERPDPPATHTA